MGPGIWDTTFVYSAAGHKVGSGTPYARITLNMPFIVPGSGFWVASGAKLISPALREAGYAKKRAGLWVVFKKTAGGATQQGKVEGSARGCAAVMAMRFLLW